MNNSYQALKVIDKVKEKYREEDGRVLLNI